MGGPEQYMFKVTRLLESHGHELAHFAYKHSKNMESAWSGYFPPHPYGDEAVFFSETGLTSRIKGASKVFFDGKVYKSLSELVEKFKPDVAYFLWTGTFMFTAAVKALYDKGIPMAVRVSDFQYVCGNYKLYRNGAICEECGKNRFYSVIYRCVKRSYAVSGLKYLATGFQKFMGINDKINVWISPSEFTIRKHAEMGFKPERFVHIPTFSTNLEGDYDYYGKKQPLGGKDYLLYAGSLHEFKGVGNLIGAYMKSLVNVPLVIIGGGDRSLVESVRAKASFAAGGKEIIYKSNIPNEELIVWMRFAAAVILPSLWYENLPNVMIESLSTGTPVIASDLGSLTEYIEDGRTGLLFPAGDEDALASRINRIMEKREESKFMREEAKKSAEALFAPEKHYNLLVAEFEKLAGKR